ncbi:MAG: DUF4340 domain-containing protein [Burkholderiales bacterium]
MTRTKKLVLISLTAVLVLLAGVMVLVSSLGKKAAGIWLSRTPVQDIVSIQIEDRESDNALAVKYENGEWNMDGVAVEQEKMAPLLATLGYMKAAYKVEDRENMAQYALDDPRVVISVELKNGGRQRYMLGDSYANTGTYMQVQDDNSIYLLDEMRADVLLTSSKVIMEIPLNQVNFNKIVGVTIKSPEKGEIRCNQSEAPRSRGDFYWRMAMPYTCNASTDGIQEIIDHIESIEWVKEVKGARQDSEYGLDAESRVFTLYDSFDRELKITVGDAQGDKVYCKISGLDGVYLIDKKILNVFDINAKEIIDPTLYYFEVASVTECAITFGEDRHSLQAVWVKDETTGKQEQRFVADGASIPSADYHTIAAALQDIKWDMEPLDESELGDEVGVFLFKRLSAPYEELLTFREVKGRPGFVSVDYGNGALGVLKTDEIKAFISKIKDVEGTI